MKYKINLETETANKLDALFVRIKEANDEAYALTKEFGATHFINDQKALAGGISLLKFESLQDDKAWTLIDKEDFTYMPNDGKKAGKILRAQIKKLPRVPLKDMWNIFKIKKFFGVPGLRKTSSCYLLEFTRKYDVSKLTDLEPLTDETFKVLTEAAKKS
jgi:hypothetical protein